MYYIFVHIMFRIIHMISLRRGALLSLIPAVLRTHRGNWQVIYIYIPWLTY